MISNQPSSPLGQNTTSLSTLASPSSISVQNNCPLSDHTSTSINSLEYFIQKINWYLEAPSENNCDSSDLRLQYAIQHLHQALELFPQAYEVKVNLYL